MPKYAWMCQNRQSFEYAYDPKYAKVLNMTGFSIYELYTAFWFCQNVLLDRVLNVSRVQNMPVFWIWNSYTGF